MKRSFIFLWYPKQRLANIIQLKYVQRPWNPRLQDPTLFRKKQKLLYGLQNSKWSIFSLISHTDLSHHLSLLLMFLPHWPVFSNLPTSRSSCLEVSVLWLSLLDMLIHGFLSKASVCTSHFCWKIFCWRFLHLIYPLKNLENITLPYLQSTKLIVVT